MVDGAVNGMARDLTFGNSGITIKGRHLILIESLISDLVFRHELSALTLPTSKGQYWEKNLSVYPMPIVVSLFFSPISKAVDNMDGLREGLF